MAPKNDDEYGGITTQMTWVHLPSTIQIQVLEELANDYHWHSIRDKKARAACAAVCPEWRDFFEDINFDKLVLHQDDLDELWNITRRRQHPRSEIDQEGSAVLTSPMPRIRHIWLRVELDEYDSRACMRPESFKESTRNNVVFTKALWGLLDILSTWAMDGCSSRRPFSLELSAHSPSDSKHDFQDFTPELDDSYPYLQDDTAQREYLVQRRDHWATQPLDNACPDNLRDSSDFRIPARTKLLLREKLMRILRFDFSGVKIGRGQSSNHVNRLPKVQLITSLLIRPQSGSTIHLYDLGILLKDSLIGLRSVRYEKWRSSRPKTWHFPGIARWRELENWSDVPNLNSVDPLARLGDQQCWNGAAAQGYLLSHLPTSLESIHLFEDFDPLTHRSTNVTESRLSNIAAPSTSALSMPSLKHLSVSSFDDKNEYLSLLAECFPNLESVALTTQQYLRPAGPGLDDIHHKAAAAAMKMPRLQIMELWNSHNGRAAIFRYESTGTATKTASILTWRCSWEGENSVVGEPVIEAWRQVASANVGRRLEFEVDPLPKGCYFQQGAFLHHLKLRKSILNGISEMQLRVQVGSENEQGVSARDS